MYPTDSGSTKIGQLRALGIFTGVAWYDLHLYGKGTSHRRWMMTGVILQTVPPVINTVGFLLAMACHGYVIRSQYSFYEILPQALIGKILESQVGRCSATGCWSPAIFQVQRVEKGGMETSEISSDQKRNRNLTKFKPSKMGSLSSKSWGYELIWIIIKPLYIFSKNWGHQRVR